MPVQDVLERALHKAGGNSVARGYQVFEQSPNVAIAIVYMGEYLGCLDYVI